MREVFETYGGVLIASIIAAIVIVGLILLFSAGDSGMSEGALHKFMLQFFKSISG